MFGASDFKEQLSSLSELLSRPDLNFEDINTKLDYLNAYEFTSSNIFEIENIEKQIVNCCTSIPSNNSLLVAKSCNLLLNLIRKLRIVFSDESLISVLKWINDAAHQSSDIAYLDILQLLNSTIKTHTTFFSGNDKTLVPFLYEKLEILTNILQPNDVKLWRILCLQSLAKVMCKEERTKIINELIEILTDQGADNLLFHAKIWRIIIETLDSLCPKGSPKWLLDKLPEIMGIVLAACVLGIDISDPVKPIEIFSSTFIPQNSSGVDTDRIDKKKKFKYKAKRISWNEKTNDDSEKQGAYNFDVYEVGVLTSDSDVSDCESSKSVNFSKEQAKARHATFNFIIRMTNILKLKQLYGYYHPLLNTLIYCLRKETLIKIQIGILAAIAAVLLHSKPFLAQAQHSEGTSFMAFSASLSELITNLHSCLGNNLSSTPPKCLLIPLLHTTATLISVSPYHRLRPSLLLSIFSNIQPYLRSKDEGVCEGGLKCLNEIVNIEPSIQEMKDILKGLKQDEIYSSTHWILSETFFFLQNPACNMKVRISCWQLLGSLCKQQFHILKDNIEILNQIFLSNLNFLNSEEQLQVVMALNKFLEQLIGKCELDSYNKELWSNLLEGPLIQLLQSPEQIASEACDCLANMGPIVFNSLKEEKRILVITLIFGCVSHEKAEVRSAAVHTLGIFLLFPLLGQDQFLFDTRDLVVKSLSDTNVTVRIKAAWALGNLVDLLVNNESRELLNEFNLQNILTACLTLVKDDEMVKSNLLRALGYILCLLTEEDLINVECKDLLERTVQFFLKCTSSGTKMKMRWNACYAIGSMLKNEELYPYSEKWMGALIKTLSNLIVSCNNFKVRVSASTALCYIKSRSYYNVQYSHVFTSLLDGLENAANMTDFREYKHQDGLKQHLCLAICHLVTLMEAEDVVVLERIMNLRMDNVSQHFAYFQNNNPPEKTGIIVTAANHIQSLMQDPNLHIHNAFLNEFKQIFHVFTNP